MTFERRRARWLGATVVVVLAYVAVVAVVPADYVMSLAPGPTFNTIGKARGAPLIEISGRPTFPTAGTLDMTTVSERGGPFGGMYVSRVLLGWIDPQIRVLPTEALYPSDVPADQIAQANQADFLGSQTNAVGAALHHLGIPVVTRVLVNSVLPDGPAAERLQPGDVIVSIDGTPIRTSEQVGTAVRAHQPGEQVRFVVERDGTRHDVEVTAGQSPQHAGEAYVGITVQAADTAPFDIEFTLDDVGGPSAGLMFSLGIVDKLTPGFLNGGKDVAGTGTITPDGIVGPIGGIQQKMYGAAGAGATLFLAPRENCQDVRGNVPTGLTVAAVGTLDEAVVAMDRFAAGQPVPAC